MAGDPSQPPSLADLACLGQLFEQHRPRLLAMARRRLAPALAGRVDPEDVLAEAFLRARQRWAAFRRTGTTSAYAWLYRIVLDCTLEAWRRETRRRRDVREEQPWPEQSSVQLMLRLIHPATDPASAAAREEVRGQMRQALALLREKDREVLLMRHEDGLSFAEVGAVLGLTENAATVRYVRGLQRLRELWQKHHPESEWGR